MKERIIIILCLLQWTLHLLAIEPILLPDTLDEEDLFSMRDTSGLTRRNLAIEKTKPTDNAPAKQINLQHYLLDDIYVPSHQSFDHKWYDHVYVGGSMGVEQIMPQMEDYKFRQMTQINGYIGKQLDRFNGLRLALGGGWGFESNRNKWMARVQTRLDYLYNISTAWNGYNPARRMEVSLLAGVGANFSWMKDVKTQFAPEAHVGLQFKCYTGPLGTINLEPYVGISSDRLDVSGTRNWHGYDIFYGFNVNYSFFLVDNLSKEARLKILQSRLADERMVNPNTMERWRTPWFIEFSDGFTFGRKIVDDGSETTGPGHETTLSIGRWLSPVMGFRLSAITSSYQSQLMGEYSYNTHFGSGRLEALLNPMGFSKRFKWDARYGAFLAFGVDMGMLTKYSTQDGTSLRKQRVRAQSYNLALHGWYRLDEDMQVFIEPRFSHTSYTTPYGNVDALAMHRENVLSLNLGLTMLIRSERYRNLYEMDNAQNYTYKDIAGPRIGVAGGLPLLQKREMYHKGGTDWSGMAYLEYRFNRAHSVRGQVDFMNFAEKSSFNDQTIDGNRLLLASLDYELSLTNICSGRLRDRIFELEAFAGPTVGVAHKKWGDSSQLVIGGNAGLKLSAALWKGISLVLIPDLYLLHTGAYSLPSANTMKMYKFSFMQTFSVGVQYKIGSLRLNPEHQRRKQRISDTRWRNRQIEKDRKAELKNEKKKAKHNNVYFE